MTKTSVLVDATSLNRLMKGVGRYTWHLCEGLDRLLGDDFELHLIAFDVELPEFPAEFRGMIHRIPYCSEFVLGTRIVPRFLRECRSDCLIRPADKIGIRYQQPTLTVCHDINPLIWSVQPRRSIRRRFIDAAWESLRGHALRSSDLVVCNSRFVQQAAIQHFRLDLNKTTVGHCGVDCRIPELASRANSRSIRNEYGSQGFILTFATGDEREGYRVLPELWKAARASGYPGRLVVAGVKAKAQYASELQEAFVLAGVQESVQFLPFLGADRLETLAGLYGEADFYLETSRHEGFGMQLVEAMACGTTCFSSGCGALNEVGGGYPLYLPIDDPVLAGREIAAAWKIGQHERDNQRQVQHALSFDWSQAVNAVVEFVRDRRKPLPSHRSMTVQKRDDHQRPKQVIFWENILSIHKSAFVRSLAEDPDLDVYFAYEQDLPESRKQMGWTLPNYGRATCLDVRDPVNWNRLVRFDDTDSLHTFGSYFLLPRTRKAFNALRMKPCRLVWITESFDFYGIRGWIRTQRARWHAFLEGECFHRVFAMGKLGVQFFSRIGIRASQLREFAYVVEPPIATTESEIAQRSSDENLPCHFIYVGQLIPRKGVDLLLRAVAQLADDRWTLQIIGDGPQSAQLRQIVAQAAIDDRVTFVGNVANEAAVRSIAAADFLILPSRWDGWGAVINESLMVGTPVIVSDSCGSSSLVVSSDQGFVFPKGNIDHLKRRLTDAINRHKMRQANRESLRQWARNVLSGRALADYFLHSIQTHDEVFSPWRRSRE